MTPAAALLALPLAVLIPRSPLPADVSGQWSVKVELAGQSRDYDLELTQKGDEVQGALVSPRTKTRYPLREGSVRDSTLKLAIPKELLGREVVFDVLAKLPGDALERFEGTLSVEGLGSGKFLATRKGPPPPKPKEKPSLTGRWKSLARVGEDREIESQVEITEKDGKLTGVATGERGSLNLKSVALAGDGKVKIAFVLPGGDGEREYGIEAAFDGPDRIKGRWSSADGSLSGEWSARREPPPPSPLRPRYRLRASLPEGKSSTFELAARVEGGKVVGHLSTAEGKKIELRSGTLKDGRVEFEVELRDQGEARKVKVSAALGEKGALRGTWTADDTSGELTGTPVEEL